MFLNWSLFLAHPWQPLTQETIANDPGHFILFININFVALEVRLSPGPKL